MIPRQDFKNDELYYEYLRTEIAANIIFSVAGSPSPITSKPSALIKAAIEHADEFVKQTKDDNSTTTHS